METDMEVDNDKQIYRRHVEKFKQEILLIIKRRNLKELAHEHKDKDCNFSTNESQDMTDSDIELSEDEYTHGQAVERHKNMIKKRLANAISNKMAQRQLELKMERINKEKKQKVNVLMSKFGSVIKTKVGPATNENKTAENGQPVNSEN